MRSFFLLITSLLTVVLNGQDVKFQGSFDADSYFTKFEGDWQITRQDGKWLITFAENFEAKKAPDLKVFFSKLPYDEIDGDNAADASQAVLVAPLSTYKGSVDIPVPSGIDPNEFQTIIVHCEKYAKLWGGSPLR